VLTTATTACGIWKRIRRADAFFQMVGVELEKAPVTASFVEHIDKCLDCRAWKPRVLRESSTGKLVDLHGHAST